MRSVIHRTIIPDGSNVKQNVHSTYLMQCFISYVIQVITCLQVFDSKMMAVFLRLFASFSDDSSISSAHRPDN